MYSMLPLYKGKTEEEGSRKSSKSLIANKLKSLVIITIIIIIVPSHLPGKPPLLLPDVVLLMNIITWTIIIPFSIHSQLVWLVRTTALSLFLLIITRNQCHKALLPFLHQHPPATASRCTQWAAKETSPLWGHPSLACHGRRFSPGSEGDRF